MNEIQNIIDTIGLEEYMNAVLVENNGRPAFMIQPSDYNEKTAKDTVTKRKLDNIKIHFPDLYQLKTDWGIIISKKKLDSKSIKTNEDIGKILGYHCYKYYEKTQNPNIERINYEIIIKLKNKKSLKYYSTHHQLFAEVCIDRSSYKKRLQDKNTIESILRSDKLLGNLIDSVELIESAEIPPNMLLSKLQNKETIDENTMDQLINYFWNINFSSKLLKIIRYTDMKNDYNRGIICTLLSYYINNPLEPFFPLFNFPDQEPDVHKKEEDFSKSLIHLLTSKKKSSTKTKKKTISKKQKKKTRTKK
jgi:hypothetical protein